MNTQQKQPQNEFSKAEEEVLNFWKENMIFQKSLDKSAPNGDFVFYDGPPFATGLPHYGHIVASIIKDSVPRYWTMNGFRVPRRWGWDCHGLPIENLVEKELGIKTKKEITQMGVDKFNEACRARVLSFVDDWKAIIRRLGRWADMDNAYKTMDMDFMESVWAVFKKLHEQGLIYEGKRPMHICPRCETTLSQSEVSEGYRDIKDLSVIAKFKIKNSPNTFVLAWTTTPWTLIANTALVVGKEIDYVKVETNNQGVSEKFILAKEKLGELFGQIEYKIIEEFKGDDLTGLEYEPLFDFYFKNSNLQNKQNGWKIYTADFVNTQSGSGIVHIAPAFGEDDMRLGLEYDLPFIQHIGMDGVIKNECDNFYGLHVKPADDHSATDVEIIKYLAHNGRLFSKAKYEHSYPHCWRCDTPLLNFVCDSFFVSVEKIKERAVDLAQEISWFPEHIKAGRFGKWLAGARDWSISRQRFWASVIPVWKCEQCGESRVIGSAGELESLSGIKVNDLHKHVVDGIKIKCEKCEGDCKRVNDVLDTWFDSGSMPYAQAHYPFENEDDFNKNFPAKFIGEGADQTRCWFYYLHVISTAIMDKPAFKNVIVNGIVLAEDGKKMSKRLQNYPDPALVFEKYGADAARFYLLSSPVMAGETSCFTEKGVLESLRKVIMLPWNVVKFYEMFSVGIDLPDIDFDTAQKNILDAWIMTRLKELLSETTARMDDYDLPSSVRPIEKFIDDLSTWYLRRSRERFKSDDLQDKQQGLAVLKFVLSELSKIMAPFTPFIAERIWQKINGFNFNQADRSVHLENWTVNFTALNDAERSMISNMELARKIAELGLAKREEVKVKVKQPLSEMRVKNAELPGEYLAILQDELNIKKIVSEVGDGDLIVELDTEITPELEMEGLKREWVRAINNFRKEKGLTVNDKIVIVVYGNDEKVMAALNAFQEGIKKDCLLNDIQIADTSEGEEAKVGDNIVYINNK